MQEVGKLPGRSIGAKDFQKEKLSKIRFRSTSRWCTRLVSERLWDRGPSKSPNSMPYKDKEKQLQYQLNWMKKRREAWIAEHGPCVKCGSCIKLEVDHIDPIQKVEHKVWSWSEERRKLELAKCQVLCLVCHKAKTKASFPKPEHGTEAAYQTLACRCPSCKEVHSARMRLRYRKA